MTEQVTILGATGSIGCKTFDVIAQHHDRFQVWGLSAETRMTELAAMAQNCDARVVAVGSKREQEFSLALGASRPNIRVLEGQEGLNALVEMPESNVVVTGIVGAAGLVPTLRAVRAGKKVLIANKEPLVMMGPEIMREAALSGATIIPLDSEHNAIFQCLPDELRNNLAGLEGGEGNSAFKRCGIRKLILTASGGPFLDYPKESLGTVTPDAASAHPRWQMGRKISIDSATMMNKGLELIEACALFSVEPSQVEIVIHPQSIVHSLVEYADGSVLAQMANPDMRIPIVNGLAYPDRISSGAERLRIGELDRLDFRTPDDDRFPCLKLAKEAANTGGTAPTILNAANEVAVTAFCNGLIGFNDIARVIQQTLNRLQVYNQATLETVLWSDQEARKIADLLVSSWKTRK
jgi:1-deoxy-D-xylulose-5-phosphate reductoisomerase